MNVQFYFFLVQNSKCLKATKSFILKKKISIYVFFKVGFSLEFFSFFWKCVLMLEGHFMLQM